MSVEVISLLSSSEASSPPPVPRRPPRLGVDIQPSSNRFSSTNTVSASSASHPNPDFRSEANHAWFLSDDEFGSPINARGSGDPSVDEPMRKRRRLGDSRPAPATASVARSRLEAPKPSSLGYLNSTTEWFTQTNQSQVDFSDNDPFASSSPRARDLTTTTRPQRPQPRYLDGDLLASSSPQVREGAAKARIGSAVIVEDIDPFASTSPGAVRRQPRSPQPAVAWDPISSSAPPPAAANHEPLNPPRSLRRTQSEVITLDDSDDDHRVRPESDDEFPDIADLTASKHRFTSLTRLPAKAAPAKPSKRANSAGPRANPAQPKKTSLERAKEKEEKAAAREAEKERKRLEKERAKEERALEKARAAALAEVNKIRTDKVSTPEMIVDLPTTLDETVRLQAETLLRDLDVQSASRSSPVDNVVRWRRKVRSRYNDELGLWEPIPERIDRENYAMVIVPAAQFVDLVLGEEKCSLESHVVRMRSSFPNDTIIYLIEGLAVWLRKNRNVRNRQFVSAVRNGLEPEAPPSSPSSHAQQQQQQQQPCSNSNVRRRKATHPSPPTYIDEEAVEEALLQLQVVHGALVHNTTAPVETARWIAVFTQHISTAPYRRQRDAAQDAGFCMESGQVRAGDGARDTYVRMLQEIGRVTAPVAYGIAAEFGTVARLVKGLEQGGPLTLEKVRKSANREGDLSERTVGQAVSRRLYKIFTGRDESSTDV